jgi:hypothetical protein
LYLNKPFPLVLIANNKPSRGKIEEHGVEIAIVTGHHVYLDLLGSVNEASLSIRHAPETSE